MTLKEFILELGKLKRRNFEKTINLNGSIRYNKKGKCYCPITAVCESNGLGYYELTDFPSAGKALGLGRSTIHRIVATADNSSNRRDFSPTLKEKMKSL